MLTSSASSSAPTAVSPGDRDDQAEVGPDDPLLDRHRRGAEPLELLHIGPPRQVGVEAGACPLGQRLQVVHLAEQVRLLLARQEGDFTEAVQLRTRALGGRGPSCELGRWRSGHLGEDRVAGAGVVEAGVSNVLDPRRQRAADARPAGQAPAVRQGPIGPGGAVDHADISCCVIHGIPLIIRRASRAGCARGGRARPAPAAGGEAAGRARSPNPRKRANRRRRSRAYHCCRARSLVRRLLVPSIVVNSAVDAAASAEGRARPASARLSAVNNVQEAVGPALPPRDPIAPVSASHPTLFLGGTGGQQIR